MGLKAIPMRADTGPIGGDLSHEFIVLADTGESAVFCNKGLVDKDILSRKIDYNADLQPIVNEWTSLYAATDEKHDKAAFEKIPEGERLAARGIEVGHIFYFGTRYSKPMNAVVAGPGGQQVTVEMGSYGIGVSRPVGSIIAASPVGARSGRARAWGRLGLLHPRGGRWSGGLSRETPRPPATTRSPPHMDGEER